jgi:asparagine synthase (glutamine-hydrolysing)
MLRRRKRGFAVNVVDDWMRHTPRPNSIAAMVSEDTSLRDLIRTDAVSQLLNNHVSGESDNHKLLFSLAVCQQWLRSA